MHGMEFALILVSVFNGVKQGGVISLVLFCIYVDGLLCKLSNAGLCATSVKFSLMPLSTMLTLYCLHQRLELCALCLIFTNFAQDYSIIFNPKKSKYLVSSEQRLSDVTTRVIAVCLDL